jgi:NADH-quinone oxidoreductase subunit J
VAVSGQVVAFYALAALAIAAALLMVVQRNPVASVLWLVLCFIGLAGLFLVMEAYFLAVIQVLVYAGAIMVLFLFVIMLLNLRGEDLEGMRLPRVPVVGIVATLLFLVSIAAVVHAARPFFNQPLSELLEASRGGFRDSVVAVGLPLFSEWILPFEVTSILLLAAIVGAVALTKKRL